MAHRYTQGPYVPYFFLEIFQTIGSQTTKATNTHTSQNKRERYRHEKKRQNVLGTKEHTNINRNKPKNKQKP